MLAEQILGKITDFDTSGKTLDTVVLTREEMLSGHGVLKTTGGHTIKLSLSRGCSLANGDVIWFGDGLIIRVEAAKEDVLVIFPQDPPDWGRICYNIGNMHKKVYLENHCVVVPYDYVLESLLKKTKAQYEKTILPIKGELINAEVHHHHH